MPQIKIVWSCSDFVKHQHRFKLTAYICGRVQFFLSRTRSAMLTWNPLTLRRALQSCVTLQSHYAKLLNQYDGGNRIAFDSVESFIKRSRQYDDKNFVVEFVAKCKTKP